jgi:hypothetical protein
MPSPLGICREESHSAEPPSVFSCSPLFFLPRKGTHQPWCSDYSEEYLPPQQMINPVAAFMPVKNYHLRMVTACQQCIGESLSDDIPQEVLDLLDEMQMHLDNANTTGNTIYANNELLKALDCCETIQEHLGITCDL